MKTITALSLPTTADQLSDTYPGHWNSAPATPRHTVLSLRKASRPRINADTIFFAFLLMAYLGLLGSVVCWGSGL
jgi:hypothetical protein